MDETVRTVHWKSPTRSLMKSTFPSMMEDYMSDDELLKHLGRQMSIHTEKYKEGTPEMELDEKEVRRMKRKNSKLKKQQSHHGMILQGPERQQLQTLPVNVETDATEEEEQQNMLRKLKEQEHDELVQGLMQLRDFYKTEYKKALKEKVEHQKKLMFERQSKVAVETKRSEEHERDVLHRVPQKLPKSVLVNDLQFKNGLQTQYYKIISLENQLKKEGNKTHEITAFWDFITAPGNLESVVEDGHFSWEMIKNHHKKSDKPSITAQKDTSDTSKPTRGFPLGAASTWRSTTHGIRTILTPSSLSDIPSERQSSSLLSSGKLRAKKTPQSSVMTIEQKFPKVEFPPLAAYRLEFGKPEPSPEEVRKLEEAQKRLEERNGLKTTLSTMFSHALANRAATQRLMDRNEDYNFKSLSGAAIVDEFHDLTSKPLSAKKKSQGSRQASSKSSGKNSRSLSRKSLEKRPKSGQSIPESVVSDSSLPCSSPEDPIAELPPLTINQLADGCVIKEASCLSTLWVNPV